MRCLVQDGGIRCMVHGMSLKHYLAKLNLRGNLDGASGSRSAWKDTIKEKVIE